MQDLYVAIIYAEYLGDKDLCEVPLSLAKECYGMMLDLMSSARRGKSCTICRKYSKSVPVSMPQNDKIIVDVTTGRSLNKKSLQDLSKILYKYDKQLGNGANTQQLELLKDLQSVWPNPPPWSNLSNGELMIES